jgi:hypothetical protein
VLKFIVMKITVLVVYPYKYISRRKPKQVAAGSGIYCSSFATSILVYGSIVFSSFQPGLIVFSTSLPSPFILIALPSKFLRLYLNPLMIINITIIIILFIMTHIEVGL